MMEKNKVIKLQNGKVKIKQYYKPRIRNDKNLKI